MSIPSTRTQEIRVGLFILAALLLMGVFAWIMGAFNPFSSSYNVSVNYSFAGGVQEGSPVRISGITAGRVAKVRFHSNRVDTQGIPIPVELILSLQPHVREAVRGDSDFFINLAGLIGEKYVEVTPGTDQTPALENGAQARGIDPPRLDQLISQSFNLAGELKKLFDEKRSGINNTLDLLLKLTSNLNRLFESVGSQKNVTAKKLDLLFDNLVGMSTDLRSLTQKIQTPEGQKALATMYQLLLRMDKVDEEALRKFLQQEGIKANLRF